jgi:hemolysin activation/secretion protein
VVKVADQAQSYGVLSVDSTPRELFNRNRTTITQTFNSVIVGGDHIQGSITHIWGDNKKDQNEGSLTYLMPLSENGLYSELYASYTASKNEAQPNVQRDFKGTIITATLGFPVIRLHDQTLTVLGGGGYQGEDQEGQANAEVRALNTTVFYNHSDPEGNSVTTSVTLTSGDASLQSNAAENGRFSHLRVGAGYIHALSFLGEDTELRVEAYGQLTDDLLPSAQRFVLGGTDFLRGYPAGVYSGNQGAAGTLEVGHKYFLGGDFLVGTSIKAFWDTGYVSNEASSAITANKPKSKTISSVGLSFSADFTQGYGVTGWLGKPLDKGNQGENLDPALYLRLTKSW